jgi:hypothetical protein
MTTTMRSLILSGLMILGSVRTARAQPASGFPGDPPAIYQAAPPFGYGSPYRYWTGSTPAGDYLRGMGAYAIGGGSSDYWTAQAEAIQARTARAVLLMEEEVVRQQGLRLHRIAAGDRARIAAYHAKREDRLRNHPEWRDVMLGDSLNLALADLRRPGDDLSQAEASAVPIPARLVKRIPLLYRPAVEAMSLEELSNGPMPSAFRQVVIDRDAARFRAFLRRTARSGEISLGELIAFMHDFGLRFGAARRPAERQMYLMLQDRLSALNKEVMDRPGAAKRLAER